MSRRTPLRVDLLLLALLGAAGPLAARGAAQDGPRLRVEYGQALALGPEGARRHFAGEGESLLLGVHELEVPPGARASVRWPGRASVGLEGPAGISFGPGAEAGTLRWTLRGGGAFELEVRRGGVSSELAPGWNAALGVGAWRLVGLPDGSARLLHRAGAPLHLDWTGRRGEVVPPIELRAGDELRLGPSAPGGLRAEASRPRGAWSGSGSWPFGARAGPAPQAAPPAPLPAPVRPAPVRPAPVRPTPRGAIGGPFAWPWADGARGTGTDTLERAAAEEGAGAELDAADRPPLGSPAAEVAPADPAAGVLPPTPAPEHGAEPAEEPGANPRPWRGLASEQLASWGPLRYEPSPFLRVEPRPGGGVWLLLDPAAPTDAWVFAPRRDYRLAPGAAVWLDGDGEQRARAGRVGAFEPGPRAD